MTNITTTKTLTRCQFAVRFIADFKPFVFLLPLLLLLPLVSHPIQRMNTYMDIRIYKCQMRIHASVYIRTFPPTCMTPRNDTKLHPRSESPMPPTHPNCPPESPMDLLCKVRSIKSVEVVPFPSTSTGTSTVGNAIGAMRFE